MQPQYGYENWRQEKDYACNRLANQIPRNQYILSVDITFELAGLYVSGHGPFPFTLLYVCK